MNVNTHSTIRRYLCFCSTLFLLLGIFSFSASPAYATVPQRIISLGPINTENVYLLGLEDRLVANTRYCVRPEAAKLKEKVGSVMSFSIEKIISLQPDLILATGLTNKSQLKRLSELGYHIATFDQPKSLEESCSHLLRLGKLLGVTERAQEVVTAVQRDVEALQQRIINLPRPKVFLQIGTQPLYGAAEDSFTHDYIRLSGGTNILAGLPSGKTHVERVIASDPDIIIIAIMGSETGIAGQEKKRWQSIPVLRAARNNTISIIDPDLACSPSPATFIETLYIIAELIHPQLKQDKS